MNNENKEINNLVGLYNKGLLQKALSSGISLSKIYPKNPVIFNILGAVYLSLKDNDNALVNFKKAVDLMPNFTEAYSNIGNIYKDSNSYQEALRYYDKALEINPNFIIAHLNKGNVLKDLGEFNKAAQSYLLAINIQPNFVEAYGNLGTVLELQNNNDLAIEYYQKAIDLNPEFYPAYENLGRLYLRLNKEKEALKVYEKLISIFPNDPLASHFISSLKGEKDSPLIKEYVRDLYESRANIFEKLLVNELGYDAPKILLKLLKEKLGKIPNFTRAIDLGCGTGLSGSVFKKYINYLIGVDFSENMIKLANEKNIYDELIVGEMDDVIKDQKNLYDLVISTDVFIYLGSLDLSFKNIQRICKKNSLFIFSTESNDKEDFKLNSTGRYSYSNNYIKKLLKDNSFDLLIHKIGELRKEKDEWIQGGFYIARKK